MEKEKIIKELKINDFIKKHSKELTIDDFLNNTYDKNRIVGFENKESVIFIDTNYMDKNNITYKDMLESDFSKNENVKFYNQKVLKDNIAIEPEQNILLHEKFLSDQKNKNIVKNRNSSKANRSVKGLR